MGDDGCRGNVEGSLGSYGFSGCVDMGVVYPSDSLDVNLEEVACRRRYSIYAMAPPTNANPTTPPTVPPAIAPAFEDFDGTCEGDSDEELLEDFGPFVDKLKVENTEVEVEELPGSEAVEDDGGSEAVEGDRGRDSGESPWRVAFPTSKAPETVTSRNAQCGIAVPIGTLTGYCDTYTVVHNCS